MNAETATMDPLANGSGDEEERASIEERAEGETPEETPEQEELFVLEGGQKVTLGTLFNRGTPVEYRFKLGGKSIPAVDSGLIGFNNPDLVLVVPVRAGDVTTSPTYDADGHVEKVTIYAEMKPRMAYDSRSEAARALLEGE